MMAEEFESYPVEGMSDDEKAKIEARVTKNVTDRLTKEFNAKLTAAREEERSQTRAELREDYNRTNLRWSWFGGISGTGVAAALIVWAILGISGCVQQGNTDRAVKDQAANQWLSDCIEVQGGRVYQESTDFNKYPSGPRLCVVGGKVTSTRVYDIVE